MPKNCCLLNLAEILGVQNHRIMICQPFLIVCSVFQGTDIADALMFSKCVHWYEQFGSIIFL